MQKAMLSVFAAAAFGALGCGDADPLERRDPRADQAGNRAAAAAEERSEASGADPVTAAVNERVARRRAELATDVGADPEEMIDEPARTAAGHIQAEEVDRYAEP